MGNAQQKGDPGAVASRKPLSLPVSQSIAWYSKGQERIVEADGVRVVVRFVGPRARRGRIAITAPPGAVFRDSRVS
jgi:hypothetical protein